MCCTNKGFWISAVKYASAITKWYKAGKPVRTPEEIENIFQLCSQCEYFQPIEGKPWRGKCGSCGCYLGRHKHKLLQGNKIAMKTENCPEGKW